MSRINLVNQLLIIFLINLIWICNCIQIEINNQNVINDEDNDNLIEQQKITKRSDNVILDGIQYLPECRILCRLHRFTTSHLPPVSINFNHQYQHYLPIGQMPVLHHPELHHPGLHNPELHHANLHSDLQLGLHSKLYHELPINHQFGLSTPAHHLGLSSTNFHETIVENNNNPTTSQLNALQSPPTQLLPANNQLQTSATTATLTINDQKLAAVQKLFAYHESKYPVTIVEENFELPNNYNSLSATPIETHQSSLRPLFVPDKTTSTELRAPSAISPYKLEDSRSTLIDYQPFPPSPSSLMHPHSHHSPHHFPLPPPPFFHNHHHPHNPYFDGLNEKEIPKNKPNIEILKLTEHDYPLPPQKLHTYNNHEQPQQNHYDHLMADANGRIKDPTTYYQHEEPQKGSIIYADSADSDRTRRPVTSKIDENSIINIGQNYGKIKHIQDQLNSLKRQYPDSAELHSGEIRYENPNKYENYIEHQVEHHHEPNDKLTINSHFGGNFEHLNPHIVSHRHFNSQPVIIEEEERPIHIGQSPLTYQSPLNYQRTYHHMPNHLPNHFPNSLPIAQPKTSNNKMQFNGFYSNFYSKLPPPPPVSYHPYKK